MTNNNLFILKSVEENVIYTGYHGYHDADRKPLNMPKKDTPYMIGVELETVFLDGSLARRKWCDAVKSNWFFMEEDCSLPTGGCEIITTPLPPKDAKNPDTWLPLISSLRANNVRSHHTSETGLHVHISKSIFGNTMNEIDNGVARVIYLYYYILNPDIRSAVFGRSSTGYAKDLDFSSTPKTNATMHTLKVALKYKEVRDQVAKELNDTAKTNRYHSVNPMNAMTLEFRQGKGTVNNVRIAAICEFVEAICLYCKRNKNISEYTTDKFLATIDKSSLALAYINKEV